MSPGKPTTRQYNEPEKEQAVRMVRQLRAELGTDHGTVRRVAEQLGVGTGSLRAWVNRAEIDAGEKRGLSSADAAKIKAFEHGGTGAQAPAARLTSDQSRRGDLTHKGRLRKSQPRAETTASTTQPMPDPTIADRTRQRAGAVDPNLSDVTQNRLL